MRVVFLWSDQRWHVGMLLLLLLLLFCFHSKVSSWWICFQAPRSPRALHSSHSQLRSVWVGGKTITEREGDFFVVVDVLQRDECIYIPAYLICVELAASNYIDYLLQRQFWHEMVNKIGSICKESSLCPSQRIDISSFLNKKKKKRDSERAVQTTHSQQCGSWRL